MTEIFTNDDQPFDRLLVLTAAGVYFANPSKESLADIRARLSQGAAVPGVVPDAKGIPYAAITAVKANKHRDDFNITYKEGARTSYKGFSFKDGATRNAAFDALERRLAPRAHRTEVQLGAARAALAPIIATCVVGLFVLGAYQAAADMAAGQEAKIEGRRQGLKQLFAWALDTVGTTGVFIIGGLVLVGCIAWMVARVRKPPLMMRLVVK